MKTKNANMSRIKNADIFAAKMILNLKEAYSLTDKQLTLQEIADYFNENEILTRRGKKWTRMQVSRLMKRIKDNADNQLFREQFD